MDVREEVKTMATRDEIKQVIAYTSLVFANYHPMLEGNPNTVDVLYDLLGDLPVDTLRVAVKSCCSEIGRAFAPSPGEIREAAIKLHMRASGVPTAAEAWGAIMESFRCTSFDQPEILNHPLVIKAIHCMGGMHAIGMSENNMADRAHFLKIYDQLLERAQEDAAELPILTEYVAARKMIGGTIKILTDKLAVR